MYVPGAPSGIISPTPAPLAPPLGTTDAGCCSAPAALCEAYGVAGGRSRREPSHAAVGTRGRAPTQHVSAPKRANSQGSPADAISCSKAFPVSHSPEMARRPLKYAKAGESRDLHAFQRRAVGPRWARRPRPPRKASGRGRLPGVGGFRSMWPAAASGFEKTSIQAGAPDELARSLCGALLGPPPASPRGRRRRDTLLDNAPPRCFGLADTVGDPRAVPLPARPQPRRPNLPRDAL